MTLSFVNILNITLTLLPQGVNCAGQSAVSFSRIKKFLDLEEHDDSDDVQFNTSINSKLLNLGKNVLAKLNNRLFTITGRGGFTMRQMRQAPRPPTT